MSNQVNRSAQLLFSLEGNGHRARRHRPNGTGTRADIVSRPRSDREGHAHIADGGVQPLYHVHLSDAQTVAEMVRRIQAGISLLKPAEWLQGDGWDEGKLAEHPYVTAADPDLVFDSDLR